MGVAIGMSEPAHHNWNLDWLQSIRRNQVIARADGRWMWAGVGLLALGVAVWLGASLRGGVTPAKKRRAA